MTRTFDPSQGLAPALIVDQVLLQQAHVAVIGNKRDDILVRCVARLLSRAKKKAFLRKGKPRELQQVTSMLENFQESGRSLFEPTSVDQAVDACPLPWASDESLSARVFRESQKSDRAASLPSELPKSAVTAAASAISASTVAALPLAPVTGRAKKKAQSRLGSKVSLASSGSPLGHSSLGEKQKRDSERDFGSAGPATQPRQCPHARLPLQALNNFSL